MTSPARLIAFVAVLAGTLSISGCDRLARLLAGKAQKEQIELARVENPYSMLDAAKEDAIVVTVTHEGVVFLGQDKVDPSQLDGMVRDRLADKADKTIYLLADARAQYRAVENAIDEVRMAGVEDVGLLAARKEGAYFEAHSACCKAPLLPMGLEVLVPSPDVKRVMPAKTEKTLPKSGTVVLQVFHRAGAAPAYRINENDVQKVELMSRLTEIYQTRAERVLFIKGDDDIDFAAMAEVVDIAQSANIDHIALLTPATMAGQ